METLYRKVIIKSEADLPKEDGIYFIGIKNPTDRFFKEYKVHIWRNAPSPEIEREIKYWIENIDWYLLPVALPSQKQEAKGPTLKEELNKFVKYADKSPHLLLTDVLNEYLKSH